MSHTLSSRALTDPMVVEVDILVLQNTAVDNLGVDGLAVDRDGVSECSISISCLVSRSVSHLLCQAKDRVQRPLLQSRWCLLMTNKRQDDELAEVVNTLVNNSGTQA